MRTVSITNAREKLYSLVDEANLGHSPIQITSKRGNAVLVAEEDWNAIQETLYLCSIPGLKESILAAAAEPISECATEPEW